MKTDELRETRARLWGELQAIAESDQALTADQAADFERIEGELDAIDVQLRDADMRDRFLARKSEPATRAIAPGTGADRIQRNDAWDPFLTYWRSGGRDRSAIEARALTIGSDLSVVPLDLQAELVRKLGAVQGARSAVDVRSYPTNMAVPVVSTRVAITADTPEGTAGDNTEPVFDSVLFSSAKTAFATTELTVQILQDARPDLIAEVLMQHAEELGRFWSSKYCAGLTGTGGSDAIFGNTANVLTLPNGDGNTTTVEAADLIRMRYEALPAEYWQGFGDLSWVMNQTTFGQLMNQLDTTGRPIFQPYQNATPASPIQGTILGLPVYLDAAAPVPAANAYTVALIARNAYRVVDREPGLVTNLNPWAQQNKGIVEVNSYHRSIGKWVRPEAAVVLRQSAS